MVPRDVREEHDLSTRIQILDPETHRLIGIVWTEDIEPDYIRSLVPDGYAALVDGPNIDRYCILP